MQKWRDKQKKISIYSKRKIKYTIKISLFFCPSVRPPVCLPVNLSVYLTWSYLFCSFPPLHFVQLTYLSIYPGIYRLRLSPSPPSPVSSLHPLRQVSSSASHRNVDGTCFIFRNQTERVFVIPFVFVAVIS